MYDNAKEFASEETIYPGKFDFATGVVGFNRVEIDLLAAGRIPSSQLKLGRATQTVVKYDDQVITIDSVCSWVNVTELEKSKLYKFTIYTIDDVGNKSVPVETELTPFTSADLDAIDVNSPRITTEPLTATATSLAASLEWPSGISSAMMDCDGFSYEYTDKDGAVQSNEVTAHQLDVTNLPIGAATEIKITYHGLPKVGGIPILDSVDMVRTIVVNTPSADSRFYPVEEAMLRANGISDFTLNGVAGVTSLIFSPATLTTFEDVVYFPALTEIDLTDAGLNYPIPTFTYSSPAGAKTGGCSWLPFLQQHTLSIDGLTALQGLLDAGQITRIRYYPNSLGIDAFLAPYVATGQVELVANPTEVLMPHEFQVPAEVQDPGTCATDITFPATDNPAGIGLENVYKVKFNKGRPTLLFTFPSQYQINMQEYRYLKMKVYPPALSKIDTWGNKFQRVWPRFLNRLWTGADGSSWGQGSGYWDQTRIFIDSEMETWVDITIDLTPIAANHTRVVWIGFNAEANNDNTLSLESDDIVYYVSNIRFTK
ncbi:hypothetical protein AGMMS49982_07010 [Bacteroidia bacterium]|nr:hypothetical protein AGMMS49982_07010 [Bacteroidia bacterium]